MGSLSSFLLCGFDIFHKKMLKSASANIFSFMAFPLPLHCFLRVHLQGWDYGSGA